MKQITEYTKNHYTGKKEGKISYISIDGLTFSQEETCKWHEDNIQSYIEYYSITLKLGVYTLDKLREIYQDYENKKEDWRNCGSKIQWCYYLAGQYALKSIIDSNSTKN